MDAGTLVRDLDESDLVAGVDSSTQSCKVELRRIHDGVRVGIGSAPHPPTIPPFSTQDPRDWWTAFAAALKDALTDAGAEASRIRGLSVAAQCHGLVLLDRSGEPIIDAPLWNDTTASSAATRIRDEYGTREWMSDVGLAPSSSLTVMKLVKLYEDSPDVLARARHVMVPHDYLTFRLTGRSCTDRSDAAGTGYFDVHRNRWRLDLLSRFVDPDIDWSSMVPRVLDPAEPAGTACTEAARSLGLEPDTIIGPGGGDQHLAAVGLGLQPGTLAFSLGTSGVALTPSRDPVIDDLGLVDSVCDATGGYLPLSCSLNAAKVTDTVARLLDVDHETLATMALNAPRHDGRPVLVAHFDGERTPPRPDDTGVLGGLTPQTTRDDVALAAFEGVVAGLVTAAQGLDRVGLATHGDVVVNGGAAASLAYRQILADEMGRPVVRLDAEQAPARGACVQAAATLRGTDIREMAELWAPDLIDRIEPRARPGIDYAFHDQLSAAAARPTP